MNSLSFLVEYTDPSGQIKYSIIKASGCSTEVSARRAVISNYMNKSCNVLGMTLIKIHDKAKSKKE